MKRFVVLIATCAAACACSPAPSDTQKVIAPAMAELTSSVAPAPRATGLSMDQLIGLPDFSWVRALARLYPDEYARTARDLEQALRGARGDERAAKLEMLRRIEPFMDERKAALHSAPTPSLVRYLERNTEVAELVARDNPERCRDMFHGPGDPDQVYSEAVNVAISHASEQLLIAAKEAEEHPVARQPKPLDPADFAEWRQGILAAGATNEDFAKIADPSMRASATPSEVCRLRVLMMRGALAASPDLAARIALSTLQRPAT